MNLDGIYHSYIILNDHLLKIGDDEYSIRGLYAKVTVPIQIFIVLIDTIVTQTFRGLIFTLGGALTCNKRIFKEGLKDVRSVLIQIVALPILALISVFHSKIAYNISNFTKLGLYSTFWLDHTISDYAVATLMRLVSIPLSSFRACLQIPISLLALDKNTAATNVLHAVIEPFCWLVALFPCVNKGKYPDAATNPFEAEHSFYIGKKFSILPRMGVIVD